MRARDTLLTPKTPGFVVVTAQVFKSTAVADRTGKCSKWYLGQSGGTASMDGEKAVFVNPADGLVIGAKGILWSGSSLGRALEPCDTLVVPEKAVIGGVPCRPCMWPRTWLFPLLAVCSSHCVADRT